MYYPKGIYMGEFYTDINGNLKFTQNAIMQIFKGAQSRERGRPKMNYEGQRLKESQRISLILEGKKEHIGGKQCPYSEKNNKIKERLSNRDNDIEKENRQFRDT